MTIPHVEFLAVEGRPREQTVPLEWPLNYAGRRITAITVRRMSTEQVEAFIEAAKTDPDATPDMLYFPEGDRVPPEVIDGMDDDDGLRVAEVMQSFLPRRLRQDRSPPATGGATP